MSTLARRTFLKRSALAAGSLALAPTSFANELKDFVSPEPVIAERSLWLYNIHTGEQVNMPFCVEGYYDPHSIQSFDLILRDHRANEAAAIDYALYEKMYYLQQLFDIKEPLYVISGYRAPKTNANLHEHSNAVAEASLHMQGKAVDIRIPGVSHRDLHKAALAMGAGGVGYYPRDGFVHIDTGNTRRWQS